VTLSETGRTFYRIIRAEEAVIDDFKSAKALGKPLRDPSQARAWEHGISVFDSLDYAKDRARSYRFLLGRWIVPIWIPRHASIEIEKTGHDRHHFTIYSTPDMLQSLVAGNAVAVDEV
jgi:hypothetical protein